MKFKPQKSKSSSSKSSHNSKAVDDHLDDEVEVWAGSSFTSIASSVTAPPSQTASFYKKVLSGQNDDNNSYFDASSVDGSDFGGTRSNEDDDDNWSWADSRSRDSGGDNHTADGVDSERASQKPKKSKKKKFKKKLKKLFGGTIEEDHDGEKEEETEAPAQPRPRRRLSLFGNVNTSDHGPDNMGGGASTDGNGTGRYNYASSTDGEISVNNRSDDGGPTNRSQDGSNDSLGYEEAAPTISRGKAKRRGSLGGLFSRKEEPAAAAPPPERKSGGRVRRASLTGMMTAASLDPPDAATEENGGDGGSGKPNRRRRNSLFGSMTASEHVPATNRHDQDSVNENSLAAASSHTTATKKRTGRRLSLTGSNYKRESTKSATAAPPKDPHWIVNQERIARGMLPFERNPMLDTLAKSMSNEMSVGHPPTPTEFYGNVGRGTSLKSIHATIMEDRSGISRKNILSERFTEFGMALTQGSDGQYYMVTLFND